MLKIIFIAHKTTAFQKGNKYLCNNLVLSILGNKASLNKLIVIVKAAMTIPNTPVAHLDFD